ncbi:DUF2651 family protein [Bacillus sp. J37]|uniref:DUF2651 family protein n=1 Tax=Bacillus sp. J37 TaxID=935837 RepID=UPI000A01AC41
MELYTLLFIFAGVVFLTSIFGYIITRKIYVPPALIFVLFSFLMLLYFNETFFIWVIIYTCFSLFITFIMFLLFKNRKEK